MFPLELLARTRPSHWVATGLAVLLVEYATGSFFQLPILYTIPVALAKATHGAGRSRGLRGHAARQAVLLLQGMLPICGVCKRIRDQGGRWNQLGSYISRHSGARFSRTLCDECTAKH